MATELIKGRWPYFFSFVVVDEQEGKRLQGFHAIRPAKFETFMEFRHQLFTVARSGQFNLGQTWAYKVRSLIHGVAQRTDYTVFGYRAVA